jgi:tartrate dehydratase alpha subunit/fumarate hydratase class I-like protein
MAHPWLKKNPFMSMWLSAAHRAAGTVRSQATAQVQRQVNAAVSEATRENLRRLSGAQTPAAVRRKGKR